MTYTGLPYTGSPVPTTVDLTKLADAITWLQTAKDAVDTKILVHLQTIPELIGNVAINEKDKNKSQYTTEAPSTAATTATSDAPVITDMGPTHFGVFPHGLEFARKHTGLYNGVISGLWQVSKNLATAIEATQYIVDHYKRTEDATAADVAKIMNDPPYVPGSSPSGESAYQPSGVHESFGTAPAPSYGDPTHGRGFE